MEENGIKYKQINIPSMMIFVLVIALFIMGSIIVPLSIVDRLNVYNSLKTNTALAQLIAPSILEVYFIYSLIINIVMFVLSMKLKLEKHPKLYPFLTFTTCNIPCGFLMIKSIRENLEAEM